MTTKKTYTVWGYKKEAVFFDIEAESLDAATDKAKQKAGDKGAFGLDIIEVRESQVQ